MAYVNLSNIIDQTANRATVNYVDNAINASLGQIANAIRNKTGQNDSLNVDGMIDSVNTLEDYTNKIYIKTSPLKLDTFDTYVGNHVTNMSYYGYFLTGNNTKHVCRLPNSVTNLYKTFGGGGYGIFSGFPENVKNIDSSYRWYSDYRGDPATYVIENNLNNLEDFYEDYPLNHIDKNSSIRIYVKSGSHVNDVFSNFFKQRNYLRQLCNLTDRSYKYDESSRTTVYYSNQYWPNLSSYPTNSNYLPILSKSITNIDNFHSSIITLFEDPNAIVSMNYAYENLGIVRGCYFPEIMSNVKYAINAFNNTNGWLTIMPHTPNLVYGNYMFYNANVLIPSIWSMHNLISMYHMYDSYQGIISFNNAKDFNKVKNAYSAFQNTKIIVDDNFPYFSSLTSATYMFNHAHMVGNTKILNNRFPNLTDMSYFMYGAQGWVETICPNTCTEFSHAYESAQVNRFVCGDNVKNMDVAYYYSTISKYGNHCPVIGNNVINCWMAYGTQSNTITVETYGNMFIYANNIRNAQYLFYYRRNDKMLNIYLFNNTTTYNTFNNNSGNVIQTYSYWNTTYGTYQSAYAGSYGWGPNVFLYVVNNLDEMKKLDTNNWYSNGVHK